MIYPLSTNKREPQSNTMKDTEKKDTENHLREIL